MVYRINKKSLELLINLSNNPKGVSIKDLVHRGFGASAEFLYKEGYINQVMIEPDITIIKPIGQNGSHLIYKITEDGSKLVTKLLKYVNDS